MARSGPGRTKHALEEDVFEVTDEAEAEDPDDPEEVRKFEMVARGSNNQFAHAMCAASQKSWNVKGENRKQKEEEEEEKNCAGI